MEGTLTTNQHPQMVLGKANNPEVQNTLTLISNRVVRLIEKGKIQVSEHQLNFSRNNSLDKLGRSEQGKLKLYERMEKMWENKQKLQTSKIDQIKSTIKRQHQVDFDQIRQREQKLEEKYRRQSQERMRKQLQERQQEERRLHMFRPSKFFEIWRRRDEAERELTYEKCMESRLLVEKRLQYSKAVKSALLPSLTKRTKRDDKENIIYPEDTIQPNKTMALSKRQVSVLGTRYLNEARKVLSNKPRLDPINMQPAQAHRYPDYMQHDPNMKVLTPRDKIIQITNSKNVNKYEQLQDIRVLAAKMDQSIGNNQNRLVDSMLTKLKVINNLIA